MKNWKQTLEPELEKEEVVEEEIRGSSRSIIRRTSWSSEERTGRKV
jgi:hypothetical protein